MAVAVVVHIPLVLCFFSCLSYCKERTCSVMPCWFLCSCCSDLYCSFLAFMSLNIYQWLSWSDMNLTMHFISTFVCPSFLTCFTNHGHEPWESMRQRKPGTISRLDYGQIRKWTSFFSRWCHMKKLYKISQAELLQGTPRAPYTILEPCLCKL